MPWRRRNRSTQPTSPRRRVRRNLVLLVVAIAIVAPALAHRAWSGPAGGEAAAHPTPDAEVVVSASAGERPGALDNAIHAAFARLDREIRQAPVQRLTLGERRQALRETSAAAILLRRGSRCAALRRVDGLRRLLQPRGARRADAAVVALERVLLRSLAIARCTRPVRSVALHRMPGGTWTARQGPGVHEQAEIRPNLPIGDFHPLRHRSPDMATDESQGYIVCGTRCGSGRRTASRSGTNDPLRFFVNKPGGIGAPKVVGLPSETEAASAKKVVFETGNNEAAYSTDDGSSFTFLDPRAIFNENSDGGADGDQVLTYAPQIDRFIWMIQYNCAPIPCRQPGTKTNRYRVAIASPADLRTNASSAWTKLGPWDVIPATMKLPGTWFDFPTIAVSGTTTARSSLYLTWTVVGGASRSVVGRINLQGLATGKPIMQWFLDSNSQVRPLRDTLGRGRFFRHVDASKLRVWTWDETSNLPFFNDVSHTTIPTVDWSSKTPSGLDWMTARPVYWKPLGATQRGNELWLSWGAGRRYTDTGDQIFKQPHIEIAVLDATSLKLLRERQIVDADYAYAYPSLATNADGDVAMAYAYGGGTRGAQPAVGLLTNRQGLFRIAPADPSGGQGDYTGVQIDWPDRTRFSSGSFAKQSDGRDHWHYTRFGRAP
jgi:hypothetical protein